jgi:hypothetical protein
MMEYALRKEKQTNIGHFDMILNPLVMPRLGIPLVQGGVNCLPCGGWGYVLICKGGGVKGARRCALYAFTSSNIMLEGQTEWNGGDALEYDCTDTRYKSCHRST